MSIREYSIHGYGLFISDEEEIMKHLVVEAEESYGILEDFCTEFNGVVLDDDHYEARDVYLLKSRKLEELANGVFFFASRHGGIFAGDDEVYSSPEEMAKEFSELIGEYLPENFDYEAHLAELTGSYCG